MRVNLPLIRAVVYYFSLPGLMLTAFWLVDKLAPNLAIADLVGPALASYAWGTVFVLTTSERLFAERFSAVRVGSTTYSDPAARQNEDYRIARLSTVVLFAFGVIVWLFTTLGPLVETSVTQFALWLGIAYCAGAGVLWVVLRYQPPKPPAGEVSTVIDHF